VKSSIFRKKSIERLSGPDELDHPTRITVPETWKVFAAVLLLICALVLYIVYSVSGVVL